MGSTGWLLDSRNHRCREGLCILAQPELENIGRGITARYQPEALKKPMPVDVETLAEIDYQMKMHYALRDLDGFILGETYFVDVEEKVLFINEKSAYEYTVVLMPRQTIFINGMMADKMPVRMRFTIAHELSHWVLQQDYFTTSGELRHACRTTAASTSKRHPRSTAEWAEWQANKLASILLLPKETLKRATAEYFDQKKLWWSQIKDFSVPKNRSTYMDYVTAMAHIFDVSKECALHRIEDLSGVVYPCNR